MRFLILIPVIIVLASPLSAMANRVDDLRNLARSIRAVEAQNSSLIQQIERLSEDMDRLETVIEDHRYTATKALHRLRKMEQSRAALTFLLSDQTFQDQYYHFKRQHYLYKALSLSISAYKDTLSDLHQTQKDIADYLKRQQHLKADIDSLLNSIATHYDDYDIERDYQSIEQDYQSLNDLLYAVTKTRMPQKDSNKPVIFSLPVSGVIQPHKNGITISASDNALVTAPAEGVIAYAGTFQNLGNIVVIKHPDHYISILRGFDRLFVDTGFYIEAQDPIGTLHQQSAKKNKMDTMLYFELRYNDRYIDPLQKITGL